MIELFQNLQLAFDIFSLVVKVRYYMLIYIMIEFFQNLQPNHRANDVIVLEDMPQFLTAKFMYGSLDITSLSGEKVGLIVFKETQL